MRSRSEFLCYIEDPWLQFRRHVLDFSELESVGHKASFTVLMSPTSRTRLFKGSSWK